MLMARSSLGENRSARTARAQWVRECYLLDWCKTFLGCFYVFCFCREERWCARPEDALLHHVNTQLWMVVHVECVMDVTSMGGAATMESNSHILKTTVRAASVWYCHTGEYFHLSVHFQLGFWWNLDKEQLYHFDHVSTILILFSKLLKLLPWCIIHITTLGVILYTSPSSISYVL